MYKKTSRVSAQPHAVLGPMWAGLNIVRFQRLLEDGGERRSATSCYTITPWSLQPKP